MDRKNITIAAMAVVAVVAVAGAVYIYVKDNFKTSAPATDDISYDGVSEAADGTASSDSGSAAASREGERQIAKDGKGVAGDKLFEIRAELVGNAAEVTAKTEFATASTSREAIAEEVLRNLRVSRQTISDRMRVEVEDQQLSSRIQAEAKTENGQTEVKAEMRFIVGSTDKSVMADESFKRLSALTAEQIIGVLEHEER